MKIIKALIINTILSSLASFIVIFPGYLLCLDLLPEDSGFVPFLLWILIFFILGFCHLLFFLPLYLIRRKDFELDNPSQIYQNNFSVLLLPLSLYLFIGYNADFIMRFNYEEIELYTICGLALMLIHSVSLSSFLHRLSSK